MNSDLNLDIAILLTNAIIVTIVLIVAMTTVAIIKQME